MNNGDTILIASTSEAIINYVCKRLNEIGAENKIYKALDEDALYDCLTANSPKLLIIEDCFWHNATPTEMLNLVNRFKKLRVYVFGVADNPVNYIKRIVRVGIDGFLNVRKGRVSFRNELKNALNGKMVIPPEIEDVKTDCFPGTIENITNRDMALVNLLCEEMDNKGIAKTLDLAEQTVRNRRSELYAKVNVKNSIGLLKYLFRKGILDFNEFIAS